LYATDSGQDSAIIIRIYTMPARRVIPYVSAVPFSKGQNAVNRHGSKRTG